MLLFKWCAKQMQNSYELVIREGSRLQNWLPFFIFIGNYAAFMTYSG